MSKSKVAANSNGTAKRKATPASWKPGQSGNPKGAPKRGESWRETVKRIADMTPIEASTMSLEIGKHLIKYGEGATLRETVILRAFDALLFDPDARMLVALMDRAEGKPEVTIKVLEEAKEKVVRLLREGKVTAGEVERKFGRGLARELFISAGISIIESGESGSGSGQPPPARRGDDSAQSPD